jgi:hypothetical protein
MSAGDRGSRAMRRTLLISVTLLLAAAVAQAVWWWPRLPERMASHFDLADRVDGWMGRQAFLVVTLGLQALMAALFLALPLLIGRLPDALINLPHKDYWLAPARREASLAHASCAVLAIGCATLLLLLVIFHGVYALNAELARGAGTAAAEAGTGAAPQLDLPVPFLALMGLYLVTVAGTLVWLLRRFRRPRDHAGRPASGASRTTG